jgi:hypothetical protein
MKLLATLALLGCTASDGSGSKPPAGDSGAQQDSASTTDDSATPTESDSHATTDSDSTDSDSTPTDSDSTPVEDSAVTGAGVAWVYYEHQLDVHDGVYLGGVAGERWRNAAGNILCEYVGDLVEIGPAPSGCPDCEWAFKLDIQSVEWGGNHCDLIDYSSWLEGWADDRNTLVEPEYWGYTPTYVTPYGTIETHVVWQYTSTFGWRPSYNDSPYHEDTVFVDGFTLLVSRQGYTYYY